MFTSSTFARNAVAAAGAALIATACLTVAVAPAAAEAVSTSKTVNYGDLNLQNPQGRAVLAARIKAAAREVCAVGGNDLRIRTIETQCVRDAVRKANAS